MSYQIGFPIFFRNQKLQLREILRPIEYGSWTDFGRSFMEDLLAIFSKKIILNLKVFKIFQFIFYENFMRELYSVFYKDFDFDFDLKCVVFYFDDIEGSLITENHE
jgi:hypothetical protein